MKIKKICLIIAILILTGCSKEIENKMIDVTNKSIEEIQVYASENNLQLEIVEKYHTLENGKVIEQSIPIDTVLVENDKLIITISKGIDYETLKVNELGEVPIMMYHGIHNVTDNKYTGGNVDKDGYQRTALAFRKDLEFYYNQGYRMIRLEDYVNGIIDVEAGKSPIILTFDDGLANNIKVTGLDDNGNIIIDPNSAVGILEQFKKEHPDMNVTATFFVNGGLFNQKEYNEKILKFLIENGYDIGNHSYSHVDFIDVTYEKSIKEIGSIYNLLEKYIGDKYVNIVALPYGSPYKKEHANFSAILNGVYEGKDYKTISTLRVGWKSSSSPFSKSFDPTFLTRIRAYDNNGKDWDIEYNFKLLEKSRYISDGNKNMISIPKASENKLGQVSLEVKTY